jgi:hypothetical protein
MVFVVTVVAAALLGFGWLVQQRIAAALPGVGLRSWRVLLQLASMRTWWLGIAVMAVGQTLAAWALQLGAVTVVEPILITCLLFAFVIGAVGVRHRLRWREVAGTCLVAAALAVFLVVADPHADMGQPPLTGSIILAGSLVAATAAALAVAGKASVFGLDDKSEATVVAVAAGVLYGLQDAATRGAIDAVDDGGARALLTTPWAFIVLAAAVPAVILSQSAFRLARLDCSLPPMATAQPIAGAALGVGLLNDRISLGVLNVALELACLVVMLVGVLLIGRSPALRGSADDDAGQTSEATAVSRPVGVPPVADKFTPTTGPGDRPPTATGGAELPPQPARLTHGRPRAPDY